MNASFLEPLLLRALDLEHSAWRWLWVLVAVLVLFHAFVVTPFVASSQRREAASTALERLEEVAAELQALAEELQGPGQVVQEVLIPALDQLAEDVPGDLLRLRATYLSLRAFVAEQRGVAEGARQPAPEGEEDGEADELAGVEPFVVENIDRIVTVGEAETRAEAVAALAPLVEEHVTHPRFSGVRELWASAAAPRIGALLDGAGGRVPTLRRHFDEATAGAGAFWTQLGEALAAQRRAVRDLVWQPPEREDWWASAEPAEGELLGFGVDAAVAQQLRRPLALDQFQATAAQTQSALLRVTEEVERRRRDLVRDVESGGLPAWMSGPGVARVVRVFPLVLGLALASLLTWITRRRRELGLLVHLAGRRGDAPAMLAWYSLRSRWGFGGALPSAGSAARGTTSLSTAFSIAGPGTVGLVWIAGAAAQLRDVEPFGQLAAVAGAGGLAWILALSYGFAVSRSLRALLGGPPDRDRSAEVAEVAEALDGHSLRR